MRSSVLLLCLAFALPLLAADPPQVATVSADLGECTAEIRVTDSHMKPVYKATLSTQVRFGFGGFHRTDLEVGTNVDGRAIISGLPARMKRPLDVTASFEGRNAIVLVDTGDNCHGTYNAILPDHPVKTTDDDDGD